VVTSSVLARQSPAKAWRHLLAALTSDVADIQGGTTAEGIHLGAMAGTIDIVLRGVTGMLARGHTPRFDPALPAEVTQLRFTVRYRGTRLDFRLFSGRMAVMCRPAARHPSPSWSERTGGSWGRARLRSSPSSNFLTASGAGHLRPLSPGVSV
jgi:Glycosyl hydrolase family 65 central catalytic domain